MTVHFVRVYARLAASDGPAALDARRAAGLAESLSATEFVADRVTVPLTAAVEPAWRRAVAAGVDAMPASGGWVSTCTIPSAALRGVAVVDGGYAITDEAAFAASVLEHLAQDAEQAAHRRQLEEARADAARAAERADRLARAVGDALSLLRRGRVGSARRVLRDAAAAAAE
jgi:hypothetical protein